MRATLEVSQEKAGNEVSPIEVRVFKTKNDITIKISDLGGGISRASSGKIFNYMYSTAPQVLHTNQCYFTSQNSLIPRSLFLKVVDLTEPGSLRTLCQCMVWVTASLCHDSTPDTSGKTKGFQIYLLNTNPPLFQGRHQDRKCGRVRDRCVCLPPETESPGPGEPPGLQRRVQRQAPQFCHSGQRLDRPREQCVVIN